VERFNEVTALLMSGLIEGPDVVLSDGRPARRWSMPPHRVYYRRHGRTVEILRVYHQVRRPIER
jgi:plasmid stabilization system protein ParE